MHKIKFGVTKAKSIEDMPQNDDCMYIWIEWK